jgi:hypothetical protein
MALLEARTSLIRIPLQDPVASTVKPKVQQKRVSEALSVVMEAPVAGNQKGRNHVEDQFH